jgi:sporulation protein YlmC with PRC-barrel domain
VNEDMTVYPQALQATKVIGNKVFNRAGELLGSLMDLVIDFEEGHIAYAVLSFGGFLGKSNKLFAVPWEALVLNPKEQTFIMDVEKDVLKKAPGFDKDHWPDNAQYQAGWLLDIYEYYGFSPYWIPGK